MKGPDNRPAVKLIGNDGNAFVVMGRVSAALRNEGADNEFIDKYINESESGDYDNLLRVAMEYADIE
jgi:hypothetical protein